MNRDGAVTSSAGTPRRAAGAVGGPGSVRWMFVQDFAVVPRPYEQVAVQLREAGDVVVRGALVAARAEGTLLHERVGPASWPVAVADSVALRPRPVRGSTDGLVVGFDWDPTGPPSLLQRLEGDLEAAPFGSGDTQLSLRCRYQPPGGLTTRRTDELLLHRIAEWTLRAFLRGVCAALA